MNKLSGGLQFTNRLYQASFLCPSFQHHYATISPTSSELKKIDLKTSKVFFLTDKKEPILEELKVPHECPWEEFNSIDIIINPESTSIETEENRKTHYFFGGLPALMQAARLLYKNKSVHVTYVNDGLTPKSLLSGHQAHVHPSEHGAEVCKFNKIFRSNIY